MRTFEQFIKGSNLGPSAKSWILSTDYPDLEIAMFKIGCDNRGYCERIRRARHGRKYVTIFKLGNQFEYCPTSKEDVINLVNRIELTPEDYKNYIDHFEIENWEE